MDKQDKLGIWKYGSKYPFLDKKYHLTLKEGSTELKNIDNIYFKCEYQNPTGSVKDRGLAFQLSSIYAKGIKEAVLSSSGNAAISAAHYSKLAHINLTIFLSPKTHPSKVQSLEKLGVRINFSKKPIKEAFLYAKKHNIYNLRASTDPVGHIGYSSLAYELYEKIGKIDAIFFPVSSGTTLVGVVDGFRKIGFLPKIFAIQNTLVHPIASLFDKKFKKTDKSLADAIVAKYTPRIDEIITIIKKSEGGAFVISDDEMTEAAKWLHKEGITTSFEGAMSLAGLWKAKENGFNFRKPVCLLTGKLYG